MVTLIFVFIAVSILVLVHEWGHFYSARMLGVRVEEFGFGFPPKLFSRVKNGIRYSFNALPFGGFVKIFGEHGEGEGDHDSFVSRPAWQRFIILGAGVFMNFVLAWIVFSIAATVGLPHAAVGLPQTGDAPAGGTPVSIIGVLPASPAEQVGLKFGDQILEMRSYETSLRIESEQDVRDFVEAYRGEEVVLLVRRGEAIREVPVTPRIQSPEGEGPLGVALARLTLVKTPWYLAPVEGFVTLMHSIRAVVSGFFSILREIVVSGKTSMAVSGPVGIFFFADDTRTLGIAYFLQFIGMLSVNLGVINVLPIPALDGGRILFLAIEKIKGRRVNPNVENIIHTVGFALLILLMVLVTYKDIVTIF